MSHPYPVQHPVAAPKKKSNAPMIIGIIAAVLLVLCGGAVACTAVLGSAVNNMPNNPDGNDGAPAAAVGLNEPARDGQFEFTVTSVDCGIAQIGSQYLNKNAQGQFCQVHVTVKNIGNEARTFHDSSQYAYNAAGQRYDADGVAGMYLDEDSRAFLEDINPGNSVNGIIVFDIPKDASIVKVELHDSAFSGGVVVNV
jgi:hypothetical protein